MPRLREVRDILLVSHSHNIINEEEFCLLYDLNKSSKLDLPYWTYSKFDLDTMNDGECKSEFRFFRNDVYRRVILIPATTPNDPQRAPITPNEPQRAPMTSNDPNYYSKCPQRPKLLS